MLEGKVERMVKFSFGLRPIKFCMSIGWMEPCISLLASVNPAWLGGNDFTTKNTKYVEPVILIKLMDDSFVNPYPFFTKRHKASKEEEVKATFVPPLWLVVF